LPDLKKSEEKSPKLLPTSVGVSGSGVAGLQKPVTAYHLQQKNQKPFAFR